MKLHRTLDHQDAGVAIDAIRSEMERRGKAGVIAVADNHGELIGLLRLEGAPVTSVTIATNKAWTAARERKPSRELGQSARHPETGFDMAYYGDPKMIGWGGGMPVVVDGTVVGSVAVSGLVESEDIELATLGVARILEAATTR